MTEEQKTCQVKMFRDVPCGRAVVPDGNKCICHSEDPGKDVDLFQKEVDEQLARDDLHDFNSFVFPKDFSFRSAGFPKDAHFNSAQFNGEANFRYAKFSGGAYFRQAKFSGKASFIGTQFSEEANFSFAQFSWKVQFEQARFSGRAGFFHAQFSGEVGFTFARFSGKADFWRAQFSGQADFNQAQFSTEASFHYAQFSEKASFTRLTQAERALLIFDRTDLQNCCFLGTDVAKIVFTVVKWPRRRKLFGRNMLFRRAVADELEPEQKNWEEVGNIYRGLQTNYTTHNRYADAGHFYVAEMDINRKTNREWRYLTPNWFYRKVSLYGQSYLRPFLWLMLVLLLFPAIILWGGMNPSAVSDAAFGQPESISYSFSRNPADCFLFQGLDGDYWTVFFKNISFLTFSREKLSAILLSPFQEALAGLQIPLIVTLIAFFLLALRRQFKRKSF